MISYHAAENSQRLINSLLVYRLGFFKRLWFLIESFLIIPEFDLLVFPKETKFSVTYFELSKSKHKYVFQISHKDFTEVK